MMHLVKLRKIISREHGRLSPAGMQFCLIDIAAIPPGELRRIQDQVALVAHESYAQGHNASLALQAAASEAMDLVLAYLAEHPITPGGR